MPTTRSKARNILPETSGDGSAKSLTEEVKRKFKPTSGKDSADGLFSKHPVVASCAKCSTQGDSSIQKKFESENQDGNCFWLCEDCYNILPEGEGRSCFIKERNNGAFFDGSENPSPILGESRYNYFPDPPSMSAKQAFHLSTANYFASFLEWMGQLSIGLISVANGLFGYSSEFITSFAPSKEFFFTRRCLIYVIILIIVLLGAVSGFILYDRSDSDDITERKSIEAQIVESFEELMRTFPHQEEDMWFNFISSFNEIAAQSDSISPAVFLVLHSNNTKTFKCIVKHICGIAHQFLNVSTSPYELDGDKLWNSYSDHGEFILDFKNKLVTERISVIKNLHKFPGELARAFHGLTDAYNPLVEKVVFIMSIPTDASHSSNVFETAEEVLSETWRNVESDSLGPLISRLTTNVMLIKDEVPLPRIC